MLELITRRVLSLPFTLLAIALIAFLLLELIPASPARMYAGPDASPEMLQAARERLALDQPLHIRFGAYVWNAVQGDLGASITTRQPVLSELLNRFPATIELTVFSVLIALAVGLPLGIASAARRNGYWDSFGKLVSFTTAALPTFFSGLLLQLIFYGRLDLLPFGARLDSALPNHYTGLLLVDTLLQGEFQLFAEALEHLILPGLTLSAITFAVVVRITRASMLDVLNQAYVQTARGKGLNQRAVLVKHALRNAAVPIITVVSARFGYLLGGAVITEAIFAWPGVGNLAVQAITSVDFPIILGFALFTGVLFVIINLATDIVCAMIDPKIRY